MRTSLKHLKLSSGSSASLTSTSPLKDFRNLGMFCSSSSQRTRAEVQAEAAAVAKSRSQEPAGSRVSSVKSDAARADVRAQAAQAVRLGRISFGELGYL